MLTKFEFNCWIVVVAVGNGLCAFTLTLSLSVSLSGGALDGW